VIAFFDEVIGHPDFQSGYNFVSDLRSWGDPNYTFVSSFAREVRSRAKIIGRCRWAMIVTGRGGCSAVRLFNTLTEGCSIEFAPFMTQQEALTWVDAGTAEWLALAAGR
jgi:hypothetical protein